MMPSRGGSSRGNSGRGSSSRGSSTGGRGGRGDRKDSSKKREDETGFGFGPRQRNLIRFQIPKVADIDYKNLPLLQKFLNDRGKIVPRRISGVSAKEQRQLATAIKRARFLALLTTGGLK